MPSRPPRRLTLGSIVPRAFNMPLRALLLVVAPLALMVPASWAQPEGWKMTDRFAGFRYEMHGSGIDTKSYHKAVQDKAESIGCFGWVQNTAKGTAVGEARCAKRAAPLLKKWLKAGEGDAVNVQRVEIKDYADTKIRYHFSHFRILDEARETCFREAPHQCEDLAQGDAKRDEL